MKKMLLILAVGMLSLQAIAKNEMNSRACTAHYYLVVVDENGTNYRTILIHNTASTCALAMKQAKEMAWDQL